MVEEDLIKDLRVSISPLKQTVITALQLYSSEKAKKNGFVGAGSVSCVRGGKTLWVSEPSLNRWAMTRLSPRMSCYPLAPLNQ